MIISLIFETACDLARLVLLRVKAKQIFSTHLKFKLMKQTLVIQCAMFF